LAAEKLTTGKMAPWSKKKAARELYFTVINSHTLGGERERGSEFVPQMRDANTEMVLMTKFFLAHVKECVLSHYFGFSFTLVCW
jgi:hypothetical protein